MHALCMSMSTTACGPCAAAAISRHDVQEEQSPHPGERLRRRVTTPVLGQSRKIVLSCAWDDSYMENEFEKHGWDIVVISEKDDLTSHAGLQKAIEAINGPDDVLWHSQPCVGDVRGQRSTSPAVSTLERKSRIIGSCSRNYGEHSRSWPHTH